LTVEAVARVVLSNRESLVLLRPYDHVLTMTVLSYKNEIKESAGFRDEIVPTDLSDQEVKLTRQLIEGMKRDAFDLGEYHDEYTEKLTMVIEAKVAGKEIVSQPAAEEPGVINLMDALKASVQRVKPPRKQKAAPAAEKPAKPPKRKAPSARTRSTLSTVVTAWTRAPRCRAIWMAAVATPPDAPVMSTLSPAVSRPRVTRPRQAVRNPSGAAAAASTG